MKTPGDAPIFAADDAARVAGPGARGEVPPLPHAETAATERDFRRGAVHGTPAGGAAAPRVTFRAFVLGLGLACGLAALNCWIEIAANVHFVGGVQMPFGAVFVLLIFVLGVNLPLRALHRAAPGVRRLLPPFSPTELLTIYSMMLFAALISTPGTDNFFITTGPTLFYYTTRENGWAELFYRHIPAHLAPGWNGTTYQREVIEPLYLGGLGLAQIPWHAWSAMLLAWGVFLLLLYSMLFWASLLFRRQWIESEALAFPLVQLPLQMVEADRHSGHPPARAFWSNRSMWFAFVLAAGFHFLRGMNFHFPDWPLIAAFQGNRIGLEFTERPLNAVGILGAEVYLGAIGLAFLMTREVSFSFWFFFLAYNFQLVFADQLGFMPGTLPKDTYLGRPTFLTFQSIGAWLMMGALLLWPVRHYLKTLAQDAVRPQSARSNPSSNEPFSARSVLLGLALSLGGLLFWSWFAGINILFALTFFGIYLLASLVLARLVVEGGMLFPQLTFSPLEWMTSAMFGANVIGAGDMTRLSFLQPMMMGDMRTNLLPGFLHAFKIAHSQNLDARGTRRLMGAVGAAIVVALAVTTFVSIATLYSAGGLAGYKWFSYGGPQSAFNGAASAIKSGAGVDPANLTWMAVGGAVVWGLTLARSRFLWFPLHPLGYIVASGYPIQRLWFSFLIGWAVKTLLLRFGGPDGVARTRPFMIGLIFGNLCAMVAWMLAGLWWNSQIPFWPA